MRPSTPDSASTRWTASSARCRGRAATAGASRRRSSVAHTCSRWLKTATASPSGTSRSSTSSYGARTFRSSVAISVESSAASSTSTPTPARSTSADSGTGLADSSGPRSRRICGRSCRRRHGSERSCSSSHETEGPRPHHRGFGGDTTHSHRHPGGGSRARSRGSGAGPARRARGGREADRKSTRLNSSHVSISYAVFCLKKKKLNGSMIDNRQAAIRDILPVIGRDALAHDASGDGDEFQIEIFDADQADLLAHLRDHLVY